MYSLIGAMVKWAPTVRRMMFGGRELVTLLTGLGRAVRSSPHREFDPTRAPMIDGRQLGETPFS